MAEKFRQNRWTKVHAQGEANFEAKNNVMDIMVGESRCQAEITYETSMVKSFTKAAHWLLHSLEVAQANSVVQMASEQVQAKAAEAGKDADEISATGDGWACTIEKMGEGVFKASLSWAVPAEDADGQQNLDLAAPAEEAKPTPKKRGRKKKTETQEVA